MSRCALPRAATMRLCKAKVVGLFFLVLHVHELSAESSLQQRAVGGRSSTPAFIGGMLRQPSRSALLHSGCHSFSARKSTTIERKETMMTQSSTSRKMKANQIRKRATLSNSDSHRLHRHRGVYVNPQHTKRLHDVRRVVVRLWVY